MTNENVRFRTFEVRVRTGNFALKNYKEKYFQKLFAL